MSSVSSRWIWKSLWLVGGVVVLMGTPWFVRVCMGLEMFEPRTKGRKVVAVEAKKILTDKRGLLEALRSLSMVNSSDGAVDGDVMKKLCMAAGVVEATRLPLDDAVSEGCAVLVYMKAAMQGGEAQYLVWLPWRSGVRPQEKGGSWEQLEENWWLWSYE